MFVLRRYDKSADVEWLFAAYTETVYSKCVEIDGIKAPTLFLKDPNSAKRATVLGWKDETNKYNEYLKNKETKKKAKAVSRKTRTKATKTVKK